MFGVIVATHGELADNLVNTAKMFTGEVRNLASVNLPQESGPDKFYEDLQKTIDKVDEGKGVLILVDLMGGTPGNNAIKLMIENNNLAIVTGVNVPMILESILSRDNHNSLSEFSESIYDSGKSGIKLHNS